MPSKIYDPQRALIDIRHNIHVAESFIGDLTYEAFLDNMLVFYGLTRCLEIISEATRRLPDELKARHSQIPWREIAGAGSVYRHDYEDVQHNRIWGTVKNRLPDLLSVVEHELAVFDKP
jgi:uncharacterized protein with HEPN domain